MDRLVSVIIPVYNAGDYLMDAVDSLKKGSFQDFEIILIDDGSTDNSPDIADRLSREDNRIRVFHTANKGAAAARNEGVKLSVGDYILFMDSDDTVDEDYISYLWSLVQKYKSDIAVCGYRLVYPSKKKKQEATDYTVKEYTGEKAMEALLYQRGMMSVPWGSIIKRELALKVPFPEGIRAEDVATVYRLFFYASKVIYSDRPLYNYYQRKTSTIYSTVSLKNRDYFKNSREIIEFVKANCIKYIDSAYSRHFSTCFQILSETGMTAENRDFNKLLYADIKKLRKRILKNGNSRKVNRTAAALSFVSVRLLHRLLRLYYKIQRNRL